MKRLILLFAVLGMLFTLQSCTQEGSDDNPDNLVAPTVPSATLFTIPTQSFGISDDKEESSTRNDKSNWIHAGVNVLVWNTVVFANTAIPIAAFGKSFDSDEEYLGNLTWEWKYVYQSPPADGSKEYDVSLTGKYISNNEEVAWTMTVAEAGSSERFVWYEGVVSTDHTAATFTVNKDPQNPKPYMQISSTRKLDTNDASIKFSNILANDPGNGDYIEWRTNNGSEYDRAYDVFTNNSLLEIESNEASKIGRVKHQSHFNDNAWHCWDANQFNIDC